MPVAQMFDECLDTVGWDVASDSAGAGASVRAANGFTAGNAGGHAVADPVPVPEPLAGLLPGGLPRGEVAALATRHQERHPDYLALALLAEALNAGLWCAAVGVPDLGLTALAGMLGPTLPADPHCAPEPDSGRDPHPAANRAAQRQAALDHLLLVPDPGRQWAAALTALADAVDLLLVRPSTPASTEIAERVDARLRPGRSPGLTHAAALLVLGGWPSARLSLRITRADWTGLSGIGLSGIGLGGIGPTAGTGRLTGCRATVVAQGWATAGRPRAARLWLPDENGSVRALSDDPWTAGRRSPSTAG